MAKSNNTPERRSPEIFFHTPRTLHVPQGGNSRAINAKIYNLSKCKDYIVAPRCNIQSQSRDSKLMINIAIMCRRPL